MPARRAPEAFDLENLHESIYPIFTQVQLTLANHRKNVVSLHKIHNQAAEVTEVLPRNKGIQLTGESAFNKVFVDMLNRVLPVKKGVAQADKVIKFVAHFVKYTAERAAEEKEKQGEEADEEDDTTASRFTTALMNHLLRGFQAKDKNVRIRVVHCVAEMISSIGEIDEDLYTTLRAALLERARDKEPYVRVQAVIALAKLQDGEDPNELPEGEPSLADILVDVLQFDPSPDVRRAALLNITASKPTLVPILSRTRDQDPTLRKILYAHVLTALPHPKLLSIAQREEIVKNGLKDREPVVRAAAGRLVGGWVDILGGSLEELLTMFDLVGSEDVAQEALFSVFVTRPDLLDAVEFNDDFWSSLAPEKAFLARVFVDFCINTKDNARLESSLPVVTALAFRIQNQYNSLLELLQENQQENDEGAPDEEMEEKEERRVNKEFILAQLLKLAVNLDCADEIGRRKMFALVRDMISQEALPEGLVARCLDVLRKLSSGERDLIRLVVEVVQELRDLIRGDEPPEPEKAPDDETQFGDERSEIGRPAAPPAEREISPEAQARAEAMDLRCLALCIGMLERVNSALSDNSVFHGLLTELIIPSVRSHDALLRERGLTALGLCGTIDKRIALSSWQLFANQMQKANDDLKQKVMLSIFDLLMVFPAEFLKPEHYALDLLRYMLGLDSMEIKAVAVEGVAKLMLSGIIKDPDLLRGLVVFYISPETEDNQPLRQCLSYFFPVFCYSSSQNQKQMQEIFLETYTLLNQHREDLDEGEEMVSSAQISLLFADWTDPLKVVEIPNQVVDYSVHVDLAFEIIMEMLKNTREWSKDDKKVMCQLLPKLHIPEDLDDDKARQLKLLTMMLQRRRPLGDTVSKNAFSRFEKLIEKRLEKQLETLTEDDYSNLTILRDRFADIDDILQSDDEDEKPSERDEGTVTPPQKTRKVATRTRTPSKKKIESEEAEVDAAIDKILESDGGNDDGDDSAGEVESQLGIQEEDEDEETE